MILTPEEKKRRWEAAYAGDVHVPKNMRRATLALFWEKRHECRWKERGITPLFNLSLKDHDDTLSFPQLYFQCESDYEAAMVILGSWKHWELLTGRPWFAELLAKWQEEKQRRDVAHARAKIKELVNKGNLPACKYMATGGWEKEEPAKPARASTKKPEAEKEPEVNSVPNPLEHGLSLLEKHNVN